MTNTILIILVVLISLYFLNRIIEYVINPMNNLFSDNKNTKIGEKEINHSKDNMYPF